MKDTIKNSIIGAFALFGLITIISGTTTQPTTHETTFGTPESHVWVIPDTFEDDFAFMYNKKTGEVRKINSYTPKAFSAISNKTNVGYIKMKEVSAE